MKLYYLYIIVLLSASAMLPGCKGKKLPRLQETYEYKDKQPFGANVAYNLLPEIFPGKFVNVTSKPFKTFHSETYIDTASFYISISKKFYCTEDDAESLLQYVKDGNTAFIAASHIDSVLLDKIGYRMATPEWLLSLMESRYSEGKLSATDTFSYFYHGFTNYFSQVDSVSGRVTGRNQQGFPNMVLLFLGKGKLYLHCDPRAFSNYFLLKNDNYRYLQQALQYSSRRPGNVFWDDYYNRGYRNSGNKRSALGILFDYPELALAFWLLLVLLLLYILFNGKRKQRVIPVVKPVENTSVAFTQAIAGLYLAEKNNKTIADKMITYFNDHIRHHYFLNTGSGAGFVQSLSKKSGAPLELLQALYSTIEKIQAAEEISDTELLGLNEQIQQFYKNRN